MAYFPNGSAGECFTEECCTCKYGAEPCPIAAVQLHFNYDAANNKVATEILDYLVKDDGTCAMKEFMKTAKGEHHPDNLYFKNLLNRGE